MAELANNTQLELSAEELQAMTDWPDALIEDYLAISRQLVQVTSETTIVIEQTAVSLSSIELVSSRVRNLTQKLNSVAELASTAKANPKVRAHTRSLQNQMELLAQNLASIAIERSGRLRLERQLPAKIMARVVLGI